MKKPFLLTPLLLMAATWLYNPAPATPFPSFPVPADSIGIEKKDGKRYILHRVDEGQTLYAVARRYGRSVAEIRAANPDMADALRYAQVIRVPIPDESLSRKETRKLDRAIREDEKMKKREAQTDTKPNPTAGGVAIRPSAPNVKPSKPAPVLKKEKDVNDPARNDPAKAGIHVVAPGQTLYSLAVRYDVSQEDLRKWNGLSSNNILIGQALIVSERASQDREPSAPVSASVPDAASPKAAQPAERVKPGTPVVRPSDRTEPDTPAPKTDSPATTSRPSELPLPKPATAPADRPERTEPVIPLPSPGNDAPMPTRGRRQSSSGVAEMIENDNSGKYLAMHRTAPIGTLVQVRNLFNNQSMWVKVVGRLPDTGVNDKILIKLSEQAFAKLSPQDKRFRAEVSYMSR